MSRTYSEPNAGQDGLGNHLNAGASFARHPRKSEVQRPLSRLRLAPGDYLAGFKQQFLKTRKIPNPELSDRNQLRAWKIFCGWIKFHNPPFPEANQVPYPRDIAKPG